MRSMVLLVSLLLCGIASGLHSQRAEAQPNTGDMSVFVISDHIFAAAAPGDSLSLGLYVTWNGTGEAPNVKLALEYDPSMLTIDEVDRQPDAQTSGRLEWSLGSFSSVPLYDVINVTGIISSNAEIGAILPIVASLSSDVQDVNPDNDTYELNLEIEAPTPDLWVWTFGLFEELEQGFLWVAERNVPTTFTTYFFNWSLYDAHNVVLVDSLPPGVEFISAIPEPTSVDGSVVTWHLGTLEEFASGEITMRVRPNEGGSMTNVVVINSDDPENDEANNRSTFQFDVVELLPPRLLRPNIIAGSVENPAIVGRDLRFEGMARAGATVTLYEGSPDGCFFEFEACNPVPLASTTAGSNRRWTMENVLDEAKDYYLYLQAELNGEQAEVPFAIYQPYVVRIDSMLDKAGFDLSHFTIETDNMVARPNALGGSSGIEPNQEWRLNVRQQAPDGIDTNEELLEYHTLRLEIEDGRGQHTEVVPPTEVKRVTDASKTGDAQDHFDSWDFIYVQKGFEPGSRVEIWCLPVFYAEDGVPIVGLVYVKCHEMLIDPAGYVYDVEIAGSEYEWPSIPPEESLITTATVTALERTGDDQWERWAAEETGQVNPQVTDEVTEDRIKVPGYFAFYVPAGQYQVHSTADGYADYTSPILTVVDAPVFHNVGMQPSAEKGTSVERPQPPEGRETLPDGVLLQQNYPNPFNPSTTISYLLLTPSEITLTVHNLLGQEVARLVHDVQQSGEHSVRFEAGDLPSGVYFYRLKAGNVTSVRKMTLVR